MLYWAEYLELEYKHVISQDGSSRVMKAWHPLAYARPLSPAPPKFVAMLENNHYAILTRLGPEGHRIYGFHCVDFEQIQSEGWFNQDYACFYNREVAEGPHIVDTYDDDRFTMMLED